MKTQKLTAAGAIRRMAGYFEVKHTLKEINSYKGMDVVHACELFGEYKGIPKKKVNLYIRQQQLSGKI